MNIEQEFEQDKAVFYLNHAAVAPWPKRAAEAASAFANQCQQVGAQRYLEWIAEETRLRQRLAELINAKSSDDIALLKNTSEGLSFIAAGLDWRQDDQIIISNQEFPSNRIPWQALASQGVNVIEVDINSPDPEAALIDAITPKTRLLSISSVQFGSGFKIDLNRLGEACQQAGVLFCVDAIQTIGAQQFDCQACQADFVIADGHKWMLGPEGLAVFWVRPSLRDQLKLTEYGWHMVEHAGDYNRTDWEPAKNATRFECGSPNMLCTHVLSASLSLLLEVGIANVENQLAERTTYLYEALSGRKDIELITSDKPERRSGIVTFRKQGQDSQQLYRRLMNAGVICAARGGGVRFSPHFYTTQRTLDKALELLS